MAWLVLISVVLVAGGWLIGRPPALALAAIVPMAAVIGRVWYEHKYGEPPETWLAATALYTAIGVVLVAVGVFGRWCFSRRSD